MFDEIYGTYFSAVARLIELAQEGKLNASSMRETVRETAYDETAFFISEKIEDQQWNIIDRNYDTPIKNRPDRPLTLTEKRWLKTLLTDPRIKLFSLDIEGLEEVEPLYDVNDIIYFDRYLDGDNYTDKRYIENFRKVVKALKERRILRIEYEGRRNRLTKNIYPVRLEYSMKDDKFRLLANNRRGSTYTINLQRIKSAEIIDSNGGKFPAKINLKKKSLTFILEDKRNALERAMLHFSDL